MAARASGTPQRRTSYPLAAMASVSNTPQRRTSYPLAAVGSERGTPQRQARHPSGMEQSESPAYRFRHGPSSTPLPDEQRRQYLAEREMSMEMKAHAAREVEVREMGGVLVLIDDASQDIVNDIHTQVALELAAEGVWDGSQSLSSQQSPHVRQTAWESCSPAPVKDDLSTPTVGPSPAPEGSLTPITLDSKSSRSEDTHRDSDYSVTPTPSHASSDDAYTSPTCKPDKPTSSSVLPADMRSPRSCGLCECDPNFFC